MKQWQKNLFIVSLIISLFLHFGTGLYVYIANLDLLPKDKVEIEMLDNKEFQKRLKQAQQIVEQDKKRINDEIDKKAKYLSRYNQKVIDETKTKNHGKFQNDALQGMAPKKQVASSQQKQTTPQEKSKTKPKETGVKNGDLPTMASLKPQFQWDKVNPMNGVSNPGPLSQTDDHLKDVNDGPQTLLSSREFVYYTYYSRIKERLRLFWEPKIKEKVNRLVVAGRHIASDEERITKLIIVLDEKGKLIKIQVLGESGIRDLDEAAIEAFQAAAPFPNPPHGIIDPDGTIKIRWDFILEA